MPATRVNVPLYLPQWLYQPLRRVKRAFSAASDGIDLRGDRDVEWSYIAAQLPRGPGEALDFGCGGGNLTLMAAQSGFHVTALDLAPHFFFWNHDGVSVVKGDLLSLDLPENYFDVIINCSSIEHVGLVGRYGVAEKRDDGDLNAMKRMRELMKPGAIMLLTIPCGRDAVFAPLHRVYGGQRLPLLLSGFELQKETYWKKARDNRWQRTSREEALDYQPTADFENVAACTYALACFVLKKPAAGGTQSKDRA